MVVNLKINKIRKQTLPNFFEYIPKMIQKIQKAQKTTLKTKKRPPKYSKNLNSGSYDKFEENIPSLTFRVD